MAEKKIVYSLKVTPATLEKLREVAAGTFRGIGQTVDMLVAEAWDKLQQKEQSK